MNDLDEIRQIINGIDLEIADLFVKRMKQSRAVIEYKLAHNLPVEDLSRESEILKREAELIGDKNISEYYLRVLKEMIEVSKEYQKYLMKGEFKTKQD